MTTQTNKTNKIINLARPQNLATVIGIKQNIVLSDKLHLQVAVDWLLKANYVVDGQGFAGKYSLYSSWEDAYPETTGYIIPTLINYSKSTNYRQPEILDSIKNSGEWLLGIQKSDGSFNGYKSMGSIVFDTGQVIFGLCALYEETEDLKYIKAATRAGDWLVQEQEENGSWVKFTYNKSPHTYHSCVAWALLELFKITQEENYKQSAIKNLDWVLNQQKSNGWFDYFSFLSGPAVLHTIGYTLQGLIESGVLLNEGKYIASAQKSANKLIELNTKSILKGFYNEKWQPTSNHKCLTGLAQIGVVWLSLFKYTKDRKYILPGYKLFKYLKSQQQINGNNKDIIGGISGSSPIWGKYMPFVYPNWAAKYFIDLGLFIKTSTNIENLKSGLIELKQILDNEGIVYWLNMGTLLGAVRDGLLIPGDEDIDLGITINEVPKLLNILSMLGNKGWQVDVTSFSIFVSKPNQNVMIEFIIYQQYQNYFWTPLIKKLPKFNAILKYVDLIAERAIYKGYHQNIPHKQALAYAIIPKFMDKIVRTMLFNLLERFGQKHYAMKFPVRYLNDLETMSLYGESFKTPNPAKDYLEVIYGESWGIPDPNWKLENTQAIDKDLFKTSDQSKYSL